MISFLSSRELGGLPSLGWHQRLERVQKAVPVSGFLSGLTPGAERALRLCGLCSCSVIDMKRVAEKEGRSVTSCGLDFVSISKCPCYQKPRQKINISLLISVTEGEIAGEVFRGQKKSGARVLRAPAPSSSAGHGSWYNQAVGWPPSGSSSPLTEFSDLRMPPVWGFINPIS